jgi:HK97 family phage major capsid protein
MKEDIRVLLEKRNNLVAELDGIVSTAKTETRSMSEEEMTKFEQIRNEVLGLDKLIKADEEARALVIDNGKIVKEASDEEVRELKSAEKNLLDFMNGERRALDVAGNNGVIPTIISDRILLKIRELSPIYNMATKFNVGGDLVFPKLDPFNGFTTAYVADMTALTPANGNFTTLKLQNFIIGNLVQISRSLMNRTDFDLLGYTADCISQSFANFLENQLLNGVGTTAMTGIYADTNVTSVTAGSATALAIDDLISTELAIPQMYAQNGSWIMNKAQFSYLRKIKDSTGMPLLLQNGGSVAQGFGWTLLGHPVYVSQNNPSTQTTGLKIMAFGDFSGLYVKFAQNLQVQMLNELYATSHAVGLVAYAECDSRVVEEQKIAVLKMA